MGTQRDTIHPHPGATPRATTSALRTRRFFVLGTAATVTLGLATLASSSSIQAPARVAESAADSPAGPRLAAPAPDAAAATAASGAQPAETAAPAIAPATGSLPAAAPAEAAPAASVPAPVVSPVPAVNRRLAANGDRRVIVLDPGHGGSESGAARGKIKEKDLTLPTALQAAEILRADGWQVVLTRTEDRSVHGGRDRNGDQRVTLADDLQARIDLANEHQAAVLVSIHYNAAANQQSGTETFYNPQRPFAEQSQRLAGLVQAELLAALSIVGHPPKDRGARTDTGLLNGGTFYLLGERAHIARPSRMPAALGEGLFLTNDAEFDLIQRPGTIAALAAGYAVAIERYLQG